MALNPAGRAAALALAAILTAPVAQAEVELSIYGGLQEAPHSTVKHSTLGNSHVGWKGKSFAMPPYYGLRATWWQTDTFGYGVEVNHAKVYADTPAKYGYDRLEFTDGMNLVTANIWRRWPKAWNNRFTPYVGAGVGLAIPHVDVQERGQPHTFGYQTTGPVVQLVAGVSMPLNDRWSAFTEYKGTWSSHDVKLDSGAKMKTDIITNAINVGVSYRF